MFGKKRRAEMRFLVGKMETITDRQFQILEKIDLLKELERVWQERDALEDEIERLNRENESIAGNAKRFAQRVYELEQSLRTDGEEDAESDH